MFGYSSLMGRQLDESCCLSGILRVRLHWPILNPNRVQGNLEHRLGDDGERPRSIICGSASP